MCLVASGSADGYQEFGIHCWDIAAGIVIVTEAGGIVMDPKGKSKNSKLAQLELDLYALLFWS